LHNPGILGSMGPTSQDCPRDPGILSIPGSRFPSHGTSWDCSRNPGILSIPGSWAPFAWDFLGLSQESWHQDILRQLGTVCGSTGHVCRVRIRTGIKWCINYLGCQTGILISPQVTLDIYLPVDVYLVMLQYSLYPVSYSFSQFVLTSHVSHIQWKPTFAGTVSQPFPWICHHSQMHREYPHFHTT